MVHGNDAVSGIVKSMGLVFGDIGTSPLYALPAIFLLILPTHENIMGILSFIVWTLILRRWFDIPGQL